MSQPAGGRATPTCTGHVAVPNGLDLVDTVPVCELVKQGKQVAAGQGNMAMIVPAQQQSGLLHCTLSLSMHVQAGQQLQMQMPT